MRSVTSPRAVSMTMGTRLVSRTFRQTAKPSMPGQHDVEDDDVRGVGLERAQPVVRMGDGRDREAELAEVLGEERAQRLVVVDEEDSRRGVWGGGHALARMKQSCSREETPAVGRGRRTTKRAPLRASGPLPRRQRPNGRQQGRLSRGKSPEAEARARGHDERCEDGFLATRPSRRAESDGTGPEHAERGTDHPPHQGKDRRLDEELDEDVPRPRAHCPTQADLRPSAP